MIAAKILAAIQAPREVSGRDGLVNLLRGWAVSESRCFPQDGESAAELIRTPRMRPCTRPKRINPALHLQI